MKNEGSCDQCQERDAPPGGGDVRPQRELASEEEEEDSSCAKSQWQEGVSARRAERPV